MGILWVFFNNDIEILDGFFMPLYHLISFSPLMNISQVAWNLLDALAERENGLFKFLEPAVRKSQMIINICFIKL